MSLRLYLRESGPTVRAFSTSLRSNGAATSTVKHYKSEDQKDVRPSKLDLFKTINELTRQGLWNSLEHKPVRFLYGEKAKRVYAVYEKFYNPKYNRLFEKWAAGKELEMGLRLIGFVVGIATIIGCYNTFVPDTIRYKYKYGIKQKLEERAKHGDSHH